MSRLEPAEHHLASGCRKSLQSPERPSCPAHCGFAPTNCNNSRICAGRNTPVYSFRCHITDLVLVLKLHPITLREHLFTRLNLAWVESNHPGTGGGRSPCSWAMPCSSWHPGSLIWQRLSRKGTVSVCAHWGSWQVPAASAQVCSLLGFCQTSQQAG